MKIPLNWLRQWVSTLLKYPPKWIVKLLGKSLAYKIEDSIRVILLYLGMFFCLWLGLILFLTIVDEVLKLLSKVVELLRDALIPAGLRGLVWRIGRLGKEVICFPFCVVNTVLGPLLRNKKENV